MASEIRQIANDFYDGHINVFLVRAHDIRKIFKLTLSFDIEKTEVFFLSMFTPNGLGLPSITTEPNRISIINSIVTEISNRLAKGEHIETFEFENVKDTAKFVYSFC